MWLEDEATDRAGGHGPGLGPRLARVWHGSENLIEGLRSALEKDPPRLPDAVRSRPVPVPWPGAALGPRYASGAALAYRLIAGGRPLGTLVIGRAGITGFPDEVTGLVEDLGRRIALAVGAARQYARQATISRVLQRGLLPGAVAEIPGVRSALVYEPLDKGGPSGDFYDVFPAGHGRWCFAVGDVQGKGPEAAVVIGLARPWLRLLAREGYDVADVLDRLNQLLLDDATEAADAAARALVAAGGPGLGTDLGPQTRFLSMLYGELVPFDGGVRCTLASAGHPLPLLLGPDGGVREVASPQTLLGVFEDADVHHRDLRAAPRRHAAVRHRRGDRAPRRHPPVRRRRRARAGARRLRGAERGTDRGAHRELVHDFGTPAAGGRPGAAGAPGGIAPRTPPGPTPGAPVHRPGTRRAPVRDNGGHAFRTPRRRARPRRRGAARVTPWPAPPSGPSGSICTSRTARPAAATATSTRTRRPSCAAPEACSPPATTTRTP